MAVAHSYQGLLALFEGDVDGAAAHFAESLKAARDWSEPEIIVEGLHGVAAITAVRGDGTRGAQLWSAAERIREALGEPLSSPEHIVFERYVQQAMNQLTDDARDRANGAGRAMPTPQAVDLALMVLATPTASVAE
jgi:hypothetical protein